MKKVYDIHVHYTFEIPLSETVEIFKEEFLKTGTEKYCFLSVPHHANNGVVDFDEIHNLKGLYLKKHFGESAYAFAHLEHILPHSDVLASSESFLSQAKTYLSRGYDGIKMLEGYPSIVKAWGIGIDSPIYEKFYSYMEECGKPIILHIANPEENWDIKRASEYAIKAGRVYDSTYPTKRELSDSVFSVLKRHPKLKLILAHMGFMSYDISEAERYMSYENTMLDITPGDEQLINMRKSWDSWHKFFEKYQDRILYGTDFYAFPRGENFEISYTRRPKFVREFFETDTEHDYIGKVFCGVKIEESILSKIYRENFIKLLGKPEKIDIDYMRCEAERLLLVKNKKSKYADSDLNFILDNI